MSQTADANQAQRHYGTGEVVTMQEGVRGKQEEGRKARQGRAKREGGIEAGGGDGDGGGSRRGKKRKRSAGIRRSGSVLLCFNVRNLERELPNRGRALPGLGESRLAGDKNVPYIEWTIMFFFVADWFFLRRPVCQGDGAG